MARTPLLTVLLLLALASRGISGLECLVGLNNDTQALECEGSWQAVQERMQQLGDQWQQTKGSLTEQLGGLVGKLQETFGNLGNTLQGALDSGAGGALDSGPGGRKK